MKAEQEASELSYQLDELSSRLEEADGLTSAQVCTLIYLTPKIVIIDIIVVVVTVIKFVAG